MNAPPKTHHRSRSVQRMISEITAKIQSGELSSGDYLPSGHELAKQYGIGYASVIRAYKTLKDAGYVETMQGRGAFVRSRRTGKLTELVVCIPSHNALSQATNPYSDWVFQKLLAGMNSATLSREMRLNLLFTDEVGSQYAEVIDGLNADVGVLFIVSAPPGWVLRLQRKKVPYALVLPMSLGSWEMELPCAYADYYGGVYEAVSTLLNNGRKHPVYLGDPEHPHESPRYKGFSDAVTAANKSAEPVLLCPEISREAGRRVMEEYLSHNKNLPCDLIVAANDQRSVGAIDALRTAGLRVPGDIAVLGFDDIPLAQETGLSTVRLPIRELGEMSVTWFLDSVVGDASGSAPHLSIPCPVIWRQTT